MVLQGIDETINVLQDAADVDNLDDGLTAGAALAFLGWGELLVPFEKLGAEKRPPSPVLQPLQERELKVLLSDPTGRPRALWCAALSEKSMGS